MDDYWQKFFGPRAAPSMKAYWMGIDRATSRLDCHAGCFYGLQEIYTPAFLRQCQALLDEAARAAKDDKVYAERVALHAEGLRSAVEYREICDAMNRGDFGRALEIYGQMVGRLEGLAAKGYANREYATAYLRRMLLKTLQAGAAATAKPNRVLAVLPDQWRMTYDDEDQGEARGLHRAECDTSTWRSVATYSHTLSFQGLRTTTILWYRTSFQVPGKHGPLALFFGEIDGLANVYVNGTRVDVAAAPADDKNKADKAAPGVQREGQARRRVPFEVDVTGQVHEGENTLVVRADNRKITELMLGGILRPVLLIEKP